MSMSSTVRESRVRNSLVDWTAAVWTDKAPGSARRPLAFDGTIAHTKFALCQQKSISLLYF